MRFNEFRIVEAEDNSLKAGPPYPDEDKENVKALQRKLEQLGYSVGSTGIDGKYGPRTTRAVRAYKKDNNIATDGMSLTGSEFSQLLTAKPVAKPTPVIKTATASAAGVEKLSSSDDAVGAKQAAEEFLGREMSDDEFNYLVRATAAEASPNSNERAAVAAVILNRARSSTYPDHIIRVLTQKNQFQAVTGTRFDRGPSKNFTGMSQRTAEQIYASFIDKLPRMDKGWLNFTSNVRAAYGAGTNIAFLDKMKNADNAQIIGKTVFGTV
jgi:peptidoglycan hydrolase-like protein with peptidoglycan-binding domain